MSKHDEPQKLCLALCTFISEIREQVAAIRAHDNIFRGDASGNAFLRRAYDSMWRELLSEIARTFDKANTGSNENCTLLRLKELCIREQYSKLFPDQGKDILLQSLDEVVETYSQLSIGTSRNKQLAHHDMNQLFEGEYIEISFDQVESLILKTADVFEKIYTRFWYGIFDISFLKYDVLVEKFEDEIKKLIGGRKGE